MSFNGELKQVDLLLDYGDRYLVVDYKSSQKNGFSHIQQVSEYKEAIAQITGKPVNAMIIYLLEECIEFVSV